MARLSRRPKRGEIHWVTLDPTIGTEIRKTRHPHDVFLVKFSRWFSL